MRKLLFVGIMIFCVSFIHAQEDYEVKETIIKDKEEKYNDIEYLEKNYGHIEPGEIIQIKPDDLPPKIEEPQPEASSETPSTPTSENLERSSSSRKVTSSGSSSSARKSSSRKRSKRKKIRLKRKRSKIKRKPKLGRRPICPRF